MLGYGQGMALGIVVQKYGGSSVATAEHIRAVAKRVERARDSGLDLVVAVSAMGKTTDRLLELAGEVSRDPSAREIDPLLATGEEESAADWQSVVLGKSVDFGGRRIIKKKKALQSART